MGGVISSPSSLKRRFDVAFATNRHPEVHEVAHKSTKTTQRRRFPLEDGHQDALTIVAGDAVPVIELKDAAVQSSDSMGFGALLLTDGVLHILVQFLDNADLRSLLFISRTGNANIAPIFFRRIGMIIRTRDHFASPLLQFQSSKDDDYSLVVNNQSSFSHLMAWRRSQIPRFLASALFSFSEIEHCAREDLRRLRNFLDSLTETSDVRLRRIILEFRCSVPDESLFRAVNRIYQTSCEELQVIGREFTKIARSIPTAHWNRLGHRISIVNTMSSLVCRSSDMLYPMMAGWTLAHLVGNNHLTRVVLTDTGLATSELDKGLAIASVPNLRKFEVEGASFLGVVLFLRRHKLIEHISILSTNEETDNIQDFQALIDTLELPCLKSLSSTPSTAECLFGAFVPNTICGMIGIRFLLVGDGFFDTTNFLRFLNLPSVSNLSTPNLRTMDVALVPLYMFLSPLLQEGRLLHGIRGLAGVNHVVLRMENPSGRGSMSDRVAALRRAIALFRDLPSIQDITVVPISEDQVDDIHAALHAAMMQAPHVSFHVFKSYKFD